MPGSLWTLCYHDILSDASYDKLSSHWVTTADVITVIESFIEAGVQPVGRGENYQSLCQHGNNLESDKLLLTFDDGYACQVAALMQIGDRYSVGGIVFVITERIGTAGFASWQALRSLAQAGYSVQSHGCTHRVLTTLDERSLYDELTRSREQIEDHIGCPVWALALPQGFLNPRVLHIAAQSGFRVIFTSRLGIGVRWHRKTGVVLVNRIVALRGRTKRTISALQERTVSKVWCEIVGASRDMVKNVLGYRVVRTLWYLSRPRRGGLIRADGERYYDVL